LIGQKLGVPLYRLFGLSPERAPLRYNQGFIIRSRPMVVAGPWPE
jgi:hypothetical protein